MKNRRFLLFIVAFSIVAGYAFSDSQTELIVQKMVENIKLNTDLDEDYGYTQTVIAKKIGDEIGTVKNLETKTYRRTWIQDRPYAELILVNGQELSSSQKAEEGKRRSEFIQANSRAPKQDGLRAEFRKVPWADLYKNYSFTRLPTDGSAAYKLAFEPKQGNLPERSRIEKVLNQMAGTLWLDDECNILKAEGRLVETVKFGLGILAKVDSLNVVFVQQDVNGVWLPFTLEASTKLHIGILHTERQVWNVLWSDPVHRHGSAYATTSAR